MGATRARLVPDPERGPWVTRMFEWRVYEQLDCNGIARRLTERGAPSRDGGPWDYGSVYNILRNPKYTGKVVFGRTPQRRRRPSAPASAKSARCRASTGPGPPTATSTPPWSAWSCGKPPRKSAASGAASATTPRRPPAGTCTRCGRGSPASSASGGCAG